MYDLVSELNASKTQVFECKQDCGHYLSYHCHMQSHSCEYCSCICFICLSSKTSHTTSISSKIKELRICNDSSMIGGAVVDKTTTAGIDAPAINTSGTATDVMTTADDSPAITAMEVVNGATTANDDPEVKRVIKLMEKCSPNLPGVHQADKYKFYLEHVGPCDLWYHDISLIETMFGCLPYDDRELIVHAFDCCNDKPFCVLFWNDPDDFKHWLIEIVQRETYAQMNRTG
jgi:hypothetical protein